MALAFLLRQVRASLRRRMVPAFLRPMVPVFLQPHRALVSLPLQLGPASRQPMVLASLPLTVPASLQPKVLAFRPLHRQPVFRQTKTRTTKADPRNSFFVLVRREFGGPKF
jgi:hypothetical protein